MKRAILLILLLLFFPLVVNAASINDTKSMSLKEALDLEGIESNYKYNYGKKDATIYLFMGDGCGYCQKFLRYVSSDSFIEKYGNRVDFEIYEVWYNDNNTLLFQKVAKYFETTANGVPFIVIGDEYFVGFAEAFIPEIEKALDKEISSTKKTNVIKEVKDNPDSINPPDIEEEEENPDEDTTKEEDDKLKERSKKEIITLAIIIVLAIFGSLLVVAILVILFLLNRREKKKEEEEEKKAKEN